MFGKGLFTYVRNTGSGTSSEYIFPHELDGVGGVGASTEVVDVTNGLEQIWSVGVLVERNIQGWVTAELSHADVDGIRANVDGLDEVLEETLELLKVSRAHAGRGV